MIWPFPFRRRKPRRIVIDNLAEYLKQEDYLPHPIGKPRPNNGFPHRITTRVNIGSLLTWSHLKVKDVNRVGAIVSRTGKPHIQRSILSGEYTEFYIPHAEAKK